MVKVLIGIPVYITNELQLDFTLQTLNSIKTKHENKIIVVGNRVDKEFLPEIEKYPGIVYIANDENTVSKAWNMAIKTAKKEGYNYVLLPNNDILFRHDTIDNLVDFAEAKNKDGLLWTANPHENPRTLHTATPDDSFDEHPHFSCFMVSVKGLMKLKDVECCNGEPYPGLFDENYKAAYFEDNDMHQRILRAGFKAYKTASAIFYHYGSRTIKTDDDLLLTNNITYEANREYFKDKWGFDIHSAAFNNDASERFAFKKPFNKS